MCMSRAAQLTPMYFCRSRDTLRLSIVKTMLSPPHASPMAAAGMMDTMWLERTV